MKKIIAIIVVFLSVNTINKLKAQDPVFSQFNSTPLTINPALTGAYGKLNNRVGVNYRNLNSGSGQSMFSTTAVSFEHKYIKGVDQAGKDYFSVGGDFLTQRMGDGLMTQNSTTLSGSYYNALNEDGSSGLSVGLSITYGSRMIDIEKARTQELFGSYGFPSAGSYDPSLSNLNANYFYTNAGVGYNVRLSEKGVLHVGAAVYRLSRSKDTKNGSSQMDPRYVFESSFKTQINASETLEFVGSSQWIANRYITTIGALYGKLLSDNDHLIEVGLLHRMNDAIIPYVGFAINNAKFGLSYDAVMGTQRTFYNAQPTAELSFVWSLK